MKYLPLGYVIRRAGFVFLLCSSCSLITGQTRTITKGEYDKASEYAVNETNAAFPFIFTVVTDFIVNGKVVSTVTDVDEREAQMRERITRTTVSDGKTSQKIQVRLDFKHNYCGDDGQSWRQSEYECFGPVSFYGPSTPENVNYSVTKTELNGRPVDKYREFSVFSPSKSDGKKNFRERISTIGENGFYISVVDTEGTVGPENVTLRRTQTWDFKTKLTPIKSPTDQGQSGTIVVRPTLLMILPSIFPSLTILNYLTSGKRSLPSPPTFSTPTPGTQSAGISF